MFMGQLPCVHSQCPLSPHCCPAAQLVLVQGGWQLLDSSPSAQQDAGISTQT